MNPFLTLFLPACEPELLLSEPTPDGVWIRREADEYGWPQVSVSGDFEAVLCFIANNWDEEAAFFALKGAYLDLALGTKNGLAV